MTECEAPDADPHLPSVPEPAGQTDGCGRPQGGIRRLARVVVPVLIGLGAISVVISVAGDRHELARALTGLRPSLVAAALGCELLSFACLGVHLALLGGPAQNVQRLAPFRLAWVLFGLGSILPAAPAEGLVMAGSALRHRRLARRRRLVVLGVSQFFATASLYVLAAIMALIVVAIADDGPLPHSWMLVVGGGITLALLALVTLLATRSRFAEKVAVVGGWLQHPRSCPPAAERRARGRAWHDAVLHVLDTPSKAAAVGLFALLAWVLDGMCLYLALHAVGVDPALDVLLLAYSFGAAASLIPFLPAGLGVVETLTPALLHLYGVPWEGALAGLLVYRALGTLLPALIGVGSLLTLQAQAPPPPMPAPAVPGAGGRGLDGSAAAVVPAQ
ncbi:MAG: flippase-like domain-containing protein [Actinomycetota bacterium]|nr:flippase-like domain-containing protein [Actinomycetota bacterium]